MNDREFTARYEADNPISPKIVSIERADGSVAKDAFSPHGGMGEQIADEVHQEAIAEAIDTGELNAYKVIYQTYISKVWLDDIFAYQNAGNESFGHKLKKVVCAEFLEMCGHEMPMHENEQYQGVCELAKDWV